MRANLRAGNLNDVAALRTAAGLTGEFVADHEVIVAVQTGYVDRHESNRLGGSITRLRTRPTGVVVEREQLLDPFGPAGSLLHQRQHGLADAFEPRVGRDVAVAAIEPIEDRRQIEKLAPCLQEKLIHHSGRGHRCHWEISGIAEYRLLI